VIPNSNATLIVRSSPRLVAPDWRNRIRQAPVIVWIAVAFVMVLIVLRGPAAFPGIWIAIVLLGLVGAVVVGAKALNARVVITPDYVESRDALRRLQRCDRVVLAAWVLGRRGSLRKVFLVDRVGRTQITLAWDSYSDAQLDQMRGALGLPKADNSA
jgi:multisubunit Na+/H+ antiporter MnhF subunit